MEAPLRNITLLSLALISSLIFAGELPEAEISEKLRYYYPVPATNPPKVYEADVIVYGASPGGVTAAVQAKRMGKKVLVAEFGTHVGGLTSGGLSATDVGNRGAIAGMADEFYAKVGVLRGFKPSAAERAFREMLKEGGVETLFEQRLKSVKKDGARIVEIEMENGNTFRGKMFVDASYEGDLMAMAKVSYTFGREANAQYNETINGVQFHTGHNFTKPVDPYVVEGDAKSGLLPLISPAAPPKAGSGDKLIQAYNFRVYMNNSAERIAFPKPKNYDAKLYALLARYLKVNPTIPIQLHHGDSNNQGAFSSDHIGGNYAWPDADYLTREKIFQDHVKYQTGFMYFIGHDESVPASVREAVAKWGLTKGEFEETNNWPHQLYIREARRMVSDYVMTENHCMSRIIPEDSVGLGSYNMDSHNCERLVVDGKVRNEGDVQIGPRKPYQISYRSIVPKESECTNLFVPVALSCTHIAYGSIRMEPQFMILGQSAGTAACFAIDLNVPVQKVPYEKLKERLLADKQKLVWDGVVVTDKTSLAPVTPEQLKGIAVDDTKAEKKGEWLEGHTVGGYVGEGYIHDNNTGKGEKSVRFSATIKTDGTYDVRASYTPHSNRATNVPYTISVNGAVKATVKVNQKQPPKLEHGFVSLGKQTLKAGETVTVEVSNAGTDGHVIVDAVQVVEEK